MKMRSGFLALCAGIALTGVCAQAQSTGQRLELGRKGETIVLEPYAYNISACVLLSLQHDPAVAKPGYGLIASPDANGWTASQTERADLYQSSRIVATVDRPGRPGPPPLATTIDISKYFGGSTPGAHMTFKTPDGKTLLEMTGWAQAVPNHKDGTAALANDRRASDPDFMGRGAYFRCSGRRALLRAR